jgi:hypothetical protein
MPDPDSANPETDFAYTLPAVLSREHEASCMLII